MARKYTCTESVVAIPGSHLEIAALKINSGNGLIRVKRVYVQEADSTLAGPQDMPIVFNRLYGASVVIGTGGTGGTINKVDRGDAASFAVVEFSPTTISTGTSTAQLAALSPYLYQGVDERNEPICILTGTDLLQILLASAPSGVTDISVTIEWEEEGI